MGGCMSKQPQKEEYNKSQKIDGNGRTSIALVKPENEITKQVMDHLLSVIKDKLELTQAPTAASIYKASQNKFKATSFHQICHGKSNTILIVTPDTQCKYIFGGFTPCQWKNKSYLEYQSDEKCASFLFTVKGGKVQIYDLKKQCKQRAILNHEDCGPVFGEGHDLYIRDECNKEKCWNNLGRSYACGYQYGSVKANEELAGCENFTVRQYEIWEVRK